MTPFDQTQADQLIADMIGCVERVASTEIMPRFRNLTAGDVDTKSGPDDLVTVADRAAEVALANGLKKVLPEAAIVGEEAVSDDPSILSQIADAPLCVIIDPIDGTANFAAGIALFGVIIAVVKDGVTAAGLLYDPVMNDTVFAVRGLGAWYAKPGQPQTRLRTRPVTALSEASGFLPLNLFPRTSRADAVARFADVRQVRSLRCSCHEYRTLATGHADFLVSPMLNSWDHAAGILVVEEAGGYARVNGTTPYRPTLHEGNLLVAGQEELGLRLAMLKTT